jgi:hypothetical protein
MHFCCILFIKFLRAKQTKIKNQTFELILWTAKMFLRNHVLFFKKWNVLAWPSEAQIIFQVSHYFIL